MCFYGRLKENDAIPCLEIVCLTKCTSNISSLGGYATTSAPNTANYVAVRQREIVGVGSKARVP